jgi:two-component system chemotaxis sensor kinase CheA
VDNEFLQDPTLIKEFLVESEEFLQRIDQDMVALESAPNDDELLNRIFRALHTIKGTSGFLGFEPVVRLSHRAEDVLNNLRKGEIQLTRRMIDALLGARDQLGKMLRDIGQGGLQQYEIDALIAELEAVQKPEAVPVNATSVGVASTPSAGEPPKETVQNEAIALPETSSPIKQSSGASPALPESAGPSVRQKQAAESTTAAQTMRVDVRKLDELINLIGELVLERNRLMRLSRDFNLGRVSSGDLDSALNQSTARLSFITEELQVAGLRTRMVPIDTVFRKFPRLVRDVARTLQKEVELVVRGEDTELDKTMVELISDPLVHLVRNSLDHGLEMPDARAAAGKPRSGTIRLEAKQEGDQIVIIIADDGGGIDPERVGRKALERGLTTPDRLRALTTREIFEFIFLPGFSTAEKTSDLSGRGVGMDVVRSNLKKLNGTIDLDSHVGAGTTIHLRLPLTLAILPVLLVKVADEVYGLPLRSVIETARIQGTEVHRIEGYEVLLLRGETLPLIRLGRVFETKSGTGDEPNDKVVILGVGDRRVAVLVDHLVGQESTVIKPLSAFLHHTASLAGATISGDGRVRLVLDPAGLLLSATNSAAHTRGAVQ